MTLDEAVDAAFRLRAGANLSVDTSEVRHLISTEVDRLSFLSTWEAQFAKGMLEPLADELYRPQLDNAAIA